MSLTIGNANSLLPGTPKYFSAIESTKDEVQRLIEEGLVGKDTNVTTRLDYKQIIVEYWSNQEHSQWKAYEATGSAVGQTAANYHLQMIHERQDLVDSYLSLFLSLSKNLNDENINASSLSEALSNYPNKSTDSHIQDFLDRNSGVTNEVNRLLSAIEEFPKNLESWLDHKNIEKPPELSRLLKNMEYDWADEKYSDYMDAYDDYESLISTFSFSESSVEKTTRDSFLNPDNKFKKVLLESAQAWASNGFNEQLEKYVAAPRAFSYYRGEAYQQYAVINNSLSALDTGQFSSSSIDFTVYNMVDNYLSGNPIDTLTDGTSHPEADLIQYFFNKNRLLIDEYISKRRMIDEFPQTLEEFRKSHSNLISKYTRDHFDELMNLSAI